MTFRPRYYLSVTCGMIGVGIAIPAGWVLWTFPPIEQGARVASVFFLLMAAALQFAMIITALEFCTLELSADGIECRSLRSRAWIAWSDVLSVTVRHQEMRQRRRTLRARCLVIKSRQPDVGGRTGYINRGLPDSIVVFEIEMQAPLDAIIEAIRTWPGPPGSRPGSVAIS